MFADLILIFALLLSKSDEKPDSIGAVFLVADACGLRQMTALLPALLSIFVVARFVCGR